MTPADVQAIGLLLSHQNAKEKEATVKLLADTVADRFRLLRRQAAAENARIDFVERMAAGGSDAVKLLAAHLPLDGDEPFLERLGVVRDLVSMEAAVRDRPVEVPTVAEADPAATLQPSAEALRLAPNPAPTPAPTDVGPAVPVTAPATAPVPPSPQHGRHGRPRTPRQ